MATEQQLINALRAADAAGNVDDARRIASALNEMRKFAPVEQFGGKQPETQEEFAERAREIYPDVDVTEGMGTGERIAAGIGATTLGLVRGAKQLGTQAAAALAPEYAKPVFEKEIQRQFAEEEEIRRREAPLMRTPGGFTGGVIGQLLPFAAGGSLLRGTSAAGLAMPTTIRGAAAQGAALGAVQPITEEESRVGGAIAGATGGTIGGAIGRVIGRPRMAPRVEREAAQVIERTARSPAAVREALAAPPSETIAGVSPTTAEATGDIGLAGLERGLAVKSREFGKELVEQRLQNNAARVKAIQDAFEGATPEDVAALRKEASDIAEKMLPDIKAARGVETMRIVRSIDRMAKSPEFINYPQAEKILAAARQRLVEPIDDASRISTARDVIQTAAKDAREGARRSLQNVQRIIMAGEQSGAPPNEIAQALSRFRGADPKGQTVIADAISALKTAERGRGDVASLYNYRKHFTQEVMPNLSGQAMRAARSFLRQLDDEIVKVAPTYKKYLSEFSRQMRRAEQAAIGAELLRRGGSAARTQTGQPTLYPEAFSRAVSRPDELVQQATGFGRATAQRVLTPEQRRVMEGVRSGLERQASAQRLGVATTGSPTAENLFAALDVGKQMRRSNVPYVGTAQDILSVIRANHSDKVFKTVQEAMRNPEKARQILSKLPTQERMRIATTIQMIGAQTGAISAVGVEQSP